MANVYGYSQTGAPPANMVTTNTSQTIPASKVFSNPSNVFFGDGSNLNLTGVVLPADVVTTDTAQNITAPKTFYNTAAGTSSGAPISVLDIANRGLLLVANAPANSYSPIVQNNDSIIVGTNGTGNKNLVITSHCNVNVGMRITNSNVTIGAGGVSAVSTNSVRVDGTDTTVTGNAAFSNDVTVSGAIAGNSVGSTTTLSCGGNLTIGAALFGRNDTTANIFSGTLPYARHPIGWTIKVSKAVQPNNTAGPYTEIVAKSPATTDFNGLSNGVWMFGCAFNNVVNAGTSVLNIIVSWGSPTNGTLLNGTPTTVSPGNQANTLHYYTNTGLNVFGYDMPIAIIQFTGNGTTGIAINYFTQYTGIPTTTFNIWATKIA